MGLNLKFLRKYVIVTEEGEGRKSVCLIWYALGISMVPNNHLLRSANFIITLPHSFSDVLSKREIFGVTHICALLKVKFL